MLLGSVLHFVPSKWEITAYIILPLLDALAWPTAQTSFGARKASALYSRFVSLSIVIADVEVLVAFVSLPGFEDWGCNAKTAAPRATSRMATTVAKKVLRRRGRRPICAGV